MSFFPSNGFNPNNLQLQPNPSNTASTSPNFVPGGSGLGLGSLGRSGIFGSPGGRGGRGGRGGFAGRGMGGFRGGRGGFRGGRGGGLVGFGSNLPPEPQGLSNGTQGTGFGVQRLPDTADGRPSFGFGGRVDDFLRSQALAREPRRIDPNQPLITQNIAPTTNRFGFREDRTLVGLEEAVQRSRNQRSLFNNPPTSSTNTNSAFTTVIAPTITTTTNLTGNGGLFNNQPVYQSMFGRPPPTTSIFTNSNPSASAQYFTGTTFTNRNSTISGRNSNFSAGRSALQSLNSRLEQPGSGPLSNANSNFYSGQSSFVQAIERHRHSRTNQSPSQLSGGIFGARSGFNNVQPSVQNSAFRNSNQAVPTKASPIQAPIVKNLSLAPVPQNMTENQLQNQSVSREESEESEEEESEEEYEEDEDEDEASEEFDEDSTTFAEDLQNLMASHQVAAPEDLFSNGVFTQNLVQFLHGFRIKAPRKKVLYRPSQEEHKQEPEAEINHPHESEEVQSREISKHVIGREVNEKLRPAKGKHIKMLKYKINKR